MASLADLKKSLNILDLPISKDSTTALGKKRRPWVSEEDDEIDVSRHVSNNVSDSLAAREPSSEQLVSNSLCITNHREQLGSNSLENTLAEKIAHVSSSLQSREQLKSNPEDTNITLTLLSLSGHEKKLLKYIFKQCQAFANLETNLLSSNDITDYLQINATHLRNLIYRLSKKNLVTVTFFKKNKSGLRKFLINKDVFEKMNYDENIINSLSTREQDVSNLSQSRERLVSENVSASLAQTLSNVSSSSSLDKTTTITNKTEKTSLPIEWQEIDFEPLEKIRFHKGHVEQLFKHGLEFQPVQESIYHFSFDLTANNKGKDIKTDPLGFFMGIMKRSGYYAAPENYESPQEQGRRLFLEQEAKKAQKKLQAEKELMMSYFELWVNQFTEQEKINLVGKTELGPNRTMLTTEHKLVMHYKNTIWPEQYKKMLVGKS